MGGSGGGGGSSGMVDYPAYMKERHAVLYDRIKDLVDEACKSNPYVGMYGWEPFCMVNKLEASVNYFDEAICNFDPINLWKDTIGMVPAYISAMIASVEDNLTPVDTNIGIDPKIDYDDFLEARKEKFRQEMCDEILPKYRRGMQNIGAVVSSAFKIGEALLWEREQQREWELELDYAKLYLSTEAQFELKKIDAAIEKARLEMSGEELKLKIAELKLKRDLAIAEAVLKSTEDIMTYELQNISNVKDVIHYNMEALRLGYVACKEWQDSKNVYTVEKQKWCLEMHKYLMDSLGSIASSAGTSYTTSQGGASRAASAIGGALGGAGMGFMMGAAKGSVGGPIGAAIGGMAGLAAGLLR